MCRWAYCRKILIPLYFFEFRLFWILFSNKKVKIVILTESFYQMILCLLYPLLNNTYHSFRNKWMFTTNASCFGDILLRLCYIVILKEEATKKYHVLIIDEIYRMIIIVCKLNTNWSYFVINIHLYYIIHMSAFNCFNTKLCHYEITCNHWLISLL